MLRIIAAGVTALFVTASPSAADACQCSNSEPSRLEQFDGHAD
jgi:hypothetical protein